MPIRTTLIAALALGAAAFAQGSRPWPHGPFWRRGRRSPDGRAARRSRGRHARTRGEERALLGGRRHGDVANPGGWEPCPPDKHRQSVSGFGRPRAHRAVARRAGHVGRQFQPAPGGLYQRPRGGRELRLERQGQDGFQDALGSRRQRSSAGGGFAAGSGTERRAARRRALGAAERPSSRRPRGPCGPPGRRRTPECQDGVPGPPDHRRRDGRRNPHHHGRYRPGRWATRRPFRSSPSGGIRPSCRLW